MKWHDFKVNERKSISLADYPTAPDSTIKNNKKKIVSKTKKNLEKIALLQEKLYADGREGLIIALQAMDAAGKDSTIKHVLSSVNPQGIDVHSFKSPSSSELSHDYLHRIALCLPPRGKIAVFNRSHYEDVLVVKVHKLYQHYQMPEVLKSDDIIEKRYRQIRHFEDYLYENALRMVKIFLHVSGDTQKERFLERMNRPEKNWKFSSGDIKERSYWDDYQKAYEDAISNTSDKHAPWYIVPADKKWYARYVISKIILHTLREIHPEYPALSPEEAAKIPSCRAMLMTSD